MKCKIKEIIKRREEISEVENSKTRGKNDIQSQFLENIKKLVTP